MARRKHKIADKLRTGFDQRTRDGNPSRELLNERPVMDKCDCCGGAMKYKRVSPTYLYACEACRETAMRALGRTVTAIQISMRKQ